MGKKKKKNRVSNRVSKKIGKKAPTISACMMVKNEEELLPQCLESIKDFVDEIIVVDTGSTDRTVEIAKSFGARVYHHPWENDFSKHRNQSISYASYDWILIMDADEAFFLQDAPNIKRIVQETRSDFLYLQCYDLEKTGEVHGVFNQVRLFKNNLGMHYTKNVHNQLQTVGKGEYVRLRFKHYGYDLSPEKMKEKHRRTTSLLLQRIHKDPEDPFNHYELALSYSMNREFEKAIEAGETALHIMRKKGLRNTYFVNAFYTVAQGYFALGDLDNAESLCREAIQIHEEDLDSYHFLAAIYFKKKEPGKCKEMSLKYLELRRLFYKTPEKMQGIYFNSFAKRQEVYFGLACIYFLEKDIDKTEEFFQKAFEESGRPLEMAKNISLFYLEKNMEKHALKWLNMTYEACTDVEDAVVTYLELLKFFPKEPSVSLHLSKLYFQLHDFNKAANCLEKVADHFLNEKEKYEKDLLTLNLLWMNGSLDHFLVQLEHMMSSLGMNTQILIDSIDDLGQIMYNIFERFCQEEQWQLAESSFRLGSMITPDQFDSERISPLLS